MVSSSLGKIAYAVITEGKFMELLMAMNDGINFAQRGMWLSLWYLARLLKAGGGWGGEVGQQPRKNTINVSAPMLGALLQIKQIDYS